MRDLNDLSMRSAVAKQGLLLALRHANSVTLDGTRDVEDQTELSAAIEQCRDARNALELLAKRLEFHRTLDRIRTGQSSGDGSRRQVTLMRLGVDAGYTIDEVRRIVDEAGGAISPPGAPQT